MPSVLCMVGKGADSDAHRVLMRDSPLRSYKWFGLGPRIHSGDGV